MIISCNLVLAIGVAVEGMEFYTDHVPFYQSVEISYEIPFDQLQFVTHEEGYLARINFIAIFEDEKGKIVKSDYWGRSYNLKSFEETHLGNESVFGEVNLSIPPGTYRLITRVEDLNSSFGGVHEEVVEIPDLQTLTLKEFALSGIKFIKKDKDSITVLPNPRRSFKMEEGISFFFEVYNREKIECLAVWKIEDITKKIVQKVEERIEIKEWIPLEEMDGNVKFYKSQVSIQNTELRKGGKYLLLLEIRKASEGENPDSVRLGKKSFTLDFSHFYSQETYLERVKQMDYIATPEEMKVLKSAPPEEWEKTYREFWKKHDPTPMSERNEAEEEYFQRVELANEKFRPPEEGWRCDRGRIFIKFGFPDEIREQPFSVSTNPYEVWYYYGPNYKFIFQDEHGIAKYSLLNRDEEMRADRERQ